MADFDLYTPEEISLFGADEAVREAYRAAAAQTAQDATINTAAQSGGLGSLGSVLGPLKVIYEFAQFVGGRMDAADARRLEAERQRQAALDDMIALGIDPREMYSPENLAETMTDWSWADDPNLTIEDWTTS